MKTLKLTDEEFDLVLDTLGLASLEAHTNAQEHQYENPDYAKELEERSEEIDRLLEKFFHEQSPE
jgi:hypothetical protein